MSDIDLLLLLLNTLCRRLDADTTIFGQRAAYYDGRQPLALASERFHTAFGARLRALADNFCALAVDSIEERLSVDGFRFTDQHGDQDAWSIWQRNGLDNDSSLAHRDALLFGRGYALVWVDADGQPTVSIESPRFVYVHHAAGNRRVRASAVKRWLDEDGYQHATLFLPDSVSMWRSATKVSAETLYATYQPDPASVTMTMPGAGWELVDTVANPLGVVPVVPFTNRPRSDTTEGRSEISDLLGIQDAINKLVADLIIASEYSSFRQRWVTGIEIPTDPETGQVVEPFNAAINRMFVSEDPQTRFGSFEASDLGNYVKAIEMLVQHLAARAAIPSHYLSALSSQQFPSGDALRSAEASLVAKVRTRQRWFGEAWEEVIRLCFAVLGDPRANVMGAETVWADAENRTEAQHIDALTKLSTLGVPNEQLWEDAGYSPQQIARFRSMTRRSALDTVALNIGTKP